MDIKLKSIQEQINSLYLERFEKYTGGFGLSLPLLPHIAANYLKNRVVVLGQETNTWYREGDDDLRYLSKDNISDICITKRYNRFIRDHAKNYGGKFWAFNRMLYKKGVIKNCEMVDGDLLSHCWLNLFLVEACKDKSHREGRPTSNPDLAEKILAMQGELLVKVLELIEPKLLICMTGPSLDPYLKDHLLGTSFELLAADDTNILSEKMLGIIQVKDKNHFLSETKIVRTYHPSYFLGRINGNKSLRSSLKNGKPSEHYTNCLFRQLLPHSSDA